MFTGRRLETAVLLLLPVFGAVRMFTGIPLRNGPYVTICYSIDKANKKSDCLGNQFRAHDLCECDNPPHVEAQVEALLAAVVEGTPVNIRPCDISKEIQPLKLGKACGLIAIKVNAPSTFQEELLCF
jgi:hypothetical protein